MLLNDVRRGEPGIPDSLVVLPLGATEQHGPHLPLGTDSIIVDHVVRTAAAAVPEVPVLLAPTFTVGYSQHHMQFGATCTVSAVTYRQMLYEMCVSLARTCSPRMMLVNGHAGNAEIVSSIVRSLAIDEGIIAAGGSYWQLARHELEQLGSKLPGRIPGHAGAFETSVMFALQESLVSEERPGPTGEDSVIEIEGLTVDAPRRRIGQEGYTDDASSGSAELGHEILVAVDSGLRRSLKAFWTECERSDHGGPNNDGAASSR